MPSIENPYIDPYEATSEGNNEQVLRLFLMRHSDKRVTSQVVDERFLEESTLAKVRFASKLSGFCVSFIERDNSCAFEKGGGNFGGWGFEPKPLKFKSVSS